MPGGTVRPKLTALVKARLVAKDESGKYTVPLHAVKRATSEIRGANG